MGLGVNVSGKLKGLSGPQAQRKRVQIGRSVAGIALEAEVIYPWPG